MQHYDIIIVGAGHGGAQAAISLRQAGFAGSIGLIGAEVHPPYERPPLSKDYLAGDKAFERMLIRPDSFWSERKIALHLGCRVTKVDATAHQVTLGDDSILAYTKLIWAAGGTPRRLSCPGGNLPGLHVVRTRTDVDQIIAARAAVRHAIVIGGGYVGLEVAATLRKLGHAVTVIEALDRVLARVAGEPLSRFYEEVHRAHGVDVRTGVTVQEIEAVGDSGAYAVSLSTGYAIVGEMIVVGIGIVPEVAPLIAAGADGDNGVEVNAHCQTSLPDIYAVGDCASHANRYAAGATIRVESVQNAADQAKVAVDHIIGSPTEYRAVPWFWSNQYDLRLQTVGISSGHDSYVIRGDMNLQSFSIIYLKQGRIVALDCVNATKDYVQGRAHVVEGSVPNLNQLADPTIPLNRVDVLR